MKHGPVGATPAAGRIYYGWVIVGSFFLLNLAGQASGTLTFGLFVIPIGEELGLSRQTIGWAQTGRLWAGGLSGVAIGWWLDRYGPRVPVLVAIVVATVGAAGPGARAVGSSAVRRAAGSWRQRLDRRGRRRAVRDRPGHEVVHPPARPRHRHGAARPRRRRGGVPAADPDTDQQPWLALRLGHARLAVRGNAAPGAVAAAPAERPRPGAGRRPCTSVAPGQEDFCAARRRNSACAARCSPRVDPARRRPHPDHVATQRSVRDPRLPARRCQRASGTALGGAGLQPRHRVLSLRRRCRYRHDDGAGGRVPGGTSAAQDRRRRFLRPVLCLPAADGAGSGRGFRCCFPPPCCSAPPSASTWWCRE